MAGKARAFLAALLLSLALLGSAALVPSAAPTIADGPGGNGLGGG